MGIEDEDASGSSPVAGSSDSPTRRCPTKLEVYKEVLRRLQEAHHPEALDPSFADDLWNHFNRLPSRYAMDVNVERAEDVLLHKRLLHLARDPSNRPVFDVRLVQVQPAIDEISGCPVQPLSTRNGSIHPPPAFGSSQNLQALALEATKFEVNGSENSAQSHANCSRPTHEITFLTEDKPKMLSLVTSLLAEVGLNIQEAHAFNTVDGYILDIFVVNGWPFEEVEKLRNALQREVLKFKKNSGETHLSLKEQIGESVFQKTPNNSMDDWELDPQFLEFESKVASGSCGDLYKGTYHSQDVAIKILKTERLNDELQKEFSQEVYIMRKVFHKNVVQFIGACTRPSNLCIVTEFMFGGSVYDILHKKKRTFKLPALLKVAIDVSRGMNYLHQNNIIHRDLKAANLLMDENEVVKVADFGVARVKAQTGVMTAETGTYRWMAPEVIQHKPYDHKVDVFSFGVVLWELLTGKVPYEYMTPIQAAVGVVQRGMRPCIPKHTHPKLADLIRRCWQQDPALRPDFSEIIQILQNISNEVANDVNDTRNDKPFGFFSALLRINH